MYLIADGANTGHVGYTAAITDSGWGNEKGPEKQQALETGKWIFTTVTFDGSEKEMSLYEDGVLIGTTKTDADLSIWRTRTTPSSATASLRTTSWTAGLRISKSTTTP